MRLDSGFDRRLTADIILDISIDDDGIINVDASTRCALGAKDESRWIND